MADSLPTANEIMNKFDGADDMLAYVKSFHGTRIEAPKNTPAPAPIPEPIQTEAAEPAAALVAENQKRETPTPAPETPPEAETKLEDVEYDLNPTSPTAKVEAKPEVPAEPTPEEVDTPEELLTDDPKTLSFKKLRTSLKEKDLELQHKLKELEDVTNKVRKYETGEELPEPVRHLEERVRELEPYERLHALKLSPAYKEAFVKPVQEIRTKVAEIAADYNIPVDIMNQAFNIENKAELNRFLSSHFDDVGALEVKQLITQAQDVTGRARQAEAEPSQAMAALEAEYKNLQTHRKQQRNSIIASTSKDGWAEALMQIKDEGKALELIYKDGDNEHNTTYVEPVVRKAASEYGKLVTMLAENGLEHLPKDLAKALARMVQLAHASAIAIETRAAAERELNALSENHERTTRYIRPAIGGGISSGGVSASKPKNLSDAVDQLVNKVIAR